MVIIMNGAGRMAKNVMKALLTAYVVTAVFLFILAFVLLKIQPDAQKTGIAILACYVISCLAGGRVCGKHAEKRKFLWGLLSGVLYFVLLLAASELREQAIPVRTTQMLTAFFLCACSGMAGGMLSP